MKKPLSRFERAIQQLVEGSFKRLFGGRLEPVEVATRLLRAMEESISAGQVADSYTIYLQTADLDFLTQQNPHLAADLTGYIVRLARLSGLLLPQQPMVNLAADDRLGQHQMRVEAQQTAVVVEPTQPQSRQALTEAIVERIQQLDAFLIQDGRIHIPLDKPFVSIGRRTNNDVVLDKPTVSRQHAQLRWRYGHFILYDLTQRGRTAVNGHVVTEYVLQPGDVITISQIPLIYGEGQSGGDAVRSSASIKDETQLLPPLPPDPNRNT